ncbi:MAG: hypothetical protein EPO68_18505 [Planctomycetota bacterium]|nr:MAG: hypothetical protein EPO68_18505 [Planctomycetota bacterium]
MIRALLLAWCVLSVPAQEPAPAPVPPVPAPEAAARPDDPAALEARLKKLVREVELNLRAIDVQLSDAAAGDAPLEVADSGLAKLLELTQQKSRSVVRDIDEILDIAEQMAQQKRQQQQRGGSGSPQQSQQPQDDAQDSQRQGKPRDGRMQREPTPEQKQPQPSEQRGNDPKDPRAANEPSPQQQRGENLPPRPPPGRGSAPADATQGWGELPDLVREVFHAQGSSDLPVHYREWIDGYWERLRTTAR